MKERLPIWFQALALMLLSIAFMGTYFWVWMQVQGGFDHRLKYGIEDATYNTLYLFMTVPIVMLGARFAWRLIRIDDENVLPAVLFGWLAIVFVLPALLAIGWWPIPAKQRLRGTGFAETVTHSTFLRNGT
jgi:hypothetical protein